MKLFQILSIFLVTILPTLGQADEKAAEKYTLFKMEGDHGDKNSNVILSFDKNINWKDVKVEAHGTFLQLKLENTFVPDSGTFVDLSGPFFKKAVSFQSAKNQGAIRVFVNGKAEDLVDLTKAEVLGDKVIISLNHDGLAKGEITSVEKDPATLLKAAEAAPAKDLLQGKLLTASIFCAVMIMALLLLFVLKPFIRKRFVKTKDLRMEEMRTLSIHSLSPKQKLALVQVGSEKILIGLSSDAISYIKTVDEPKAAPQVQRAVKQQTSRPAPVMRRPENNIQEAVQVARRAAEKTQQNKQHSHNTESATQPAREVKLSPAEKLLQKEDRGAKLELSRSRSIVRKEDAEKNFAVHDIKQMIRDKLKQMPQIS